MSHFCIFKTTCFISITNCRWFFALLLILFFEQAFSLIDFLAEGLIRLKGSSEVTAFQGKDWF